MFLMNLSIFLFNLAAFCYRSEHASKQKTENTQKMIGRFYMIVDISFIFHVDGLVIFLNLPNAHCNKHLAEIYHIFQSTPFLFLLCFSVNSYEMIKVARHSGVQSLTLLSAILLLFYLTRITNNAC